MLRGLATALSLIACASLAGTAAAVDVTVDPARIVNAFMNVSNLPPPDGDGAYQFGAPWGFADLTAAFAGNDLTLGPNSINDPNEYWYRCVGGAVPPNCGGPGAPGNKIMEANSYAEVNDGSLAGQNVTFSGIVLSSTLTSAHVAYAFIRDFAPDYSSFVGNVIPLPASGLFSLSLATVNDPARHVQYGFQLVGVNVWATDVGPYGSVTIGPDPATSAATATWGRIKTMYR
jgi:hypothetical protein